MLSIAENDVPMGVSESSLPKDLCFLQDAAKHNPTRRVVKKSKKVRFFPSVGVRLTVSRKEITEEEKRAAWFTQEEYQMIRAKCAAIVQFSSQNEGNNKAPRVCTRGLEAHFGNVMYERMAKRELIAMAILEIQDMNPFYTDKELASVCLPCSEQSAMAAALKGVSDWKEAQRCVSQTWKRER